VSEAEIAVAAEAAFISIAVSLRGGLDGKIDLQSDWDDLPDPIRAAFKEAARGIAERFEESR
jgi:hypothetical protein